MFDVPVLSGPEALRRSAARRPFHDDAYAFYSSLLGGIVTEPALMAVPVDDHMVHRGDAVFETLKAVDGGVYLLDAHLDRLFASAGRIGLKLPWTREDLSGAILATLRAGRRPEALVRVLCSRGPGGMGISPYECPAPALYVLAHKLSPPFMAAHPAGARVVSSRIPVKAGFFATVKSCNYLPNALMKKEAVDAGADFALGFDEHGFLAEGATENAGLVTPGGVLRVPKPDRILQGTTMTRVLTLARAHAGRPPLSGIEHADLPRADLAAAAELLIFGTTPEVTAVVALDGQPAGGGHPGPVFRLLASLLAADLRASRTLW